MYLMLCSGAWLVRTTYELVYQLKFVNIQDIRKNRNEPSFMEIITIFFHTWPIFLIVCFMFALGVKKNDGLWSTEQPFMTQNSDGSQDVPLQPQDSRRDSSLHNTSGQESSARVSSPPAYTSSLGSNRSAQRLMPNNSSANPPSAQRPNGQPRQGQQPSGSRRQELGAHDQGLVANLGPPQQYQPPVRDNAYNTGIVSPVTPSEAGPADGFGTSMSIPSQSPPPHDEAMGLYHQADGRPPGMEPLPYPEKN